MALSASDNAALAVAGKNFSGFFATLAFQTFFFGIYTVLMAFSVVVHWRKESMSRASRVMFIITCIMFVSTTMYYASSTLAMVIQLNAVMVDQKTLDVKQRLSMLPDMKIAYNVLENWLSAVNFCLSDVVVVWRAYALSAGNRKIVIPSLVLLFLTLVSAGIFAGYSCVTGNPATSPVLWATIWAADQLAMETLSLATNISATAVIGYKAWKHRRMTIASSTYHSITYGAEQILTLLVESGIFYCVIQALLVILTYLFRFSPNDAQGANIVRSALGGYFGTFLILSGIYPTLIVLLVAMQRSVSDTKMWKSSQALITPGASMVSFPGPNNASNNNYNNGGGGSSVGGVSVVTEKYQQTSYPSVHSRNVSNAPSAVSSTYDHYNTGAAPPPVVAAPATYNHRPAPSNASDVQYGYALSSANDVETGAATRGELVRADTAGSSYSYKTDVESQTSRHTFKQENGRTYF